MKHIFDIDIAKSYGVYEAVLLENFYYWYKHNQANNTNFHEGRYWTYNSTKAFSELFPYMTEKKIYRVLNKLEEEGLICTGNYNKLKFDRTKWYSLTDKGLSIFQNENTHFPKMENGVPRNDQTIPYINTDINSNIKNNIVPDKSETVPSPAKSIIDYLNKKTGSKYRSGTADTKKHINARLNEGFTEADFITVIDKKVAEWKGTDMEKYLRPATLFGTKFEGYLNQQGKGMPVEDKDSIEYQNEHMLDKVFGL